MQEELTISADEQRQDPSSTVPNAPRTTTARAVDADVVAADAESAERYPNRFKKNNSAALVVGARSKAFWDAQADVRRALEDELLSDAGSSRDDAPAALRLAVESIAAATLIMRSAFERINEAGGPLTVNGRGRRAFQIWIQSADRQERGLRLVGLQRKSKPVDPIEAIHQAVAEANRK